MRSVRCFRAIIAVLIVTFAGFVGRADAKVLQLWCVEVPPCWKKDCYSYTLTLDTVQQTASWKNGKGQQVGPFPITQSSTEYSWHYPGSDKKRYLATLNRDTLERVNTSESGDRLVERYHCSLSHNAI